MIYNTNDSLQKVFVMNNVVETVKEKLLEYVKQSCEYDRQDSWNKHIYQHIKNVYRYAHDLAIKRGADVEICELGALFHDMSKVANFGPRDEHEKYGAQMARSILTELGYPDNKIDLVEKCVLHHSSDKDCTRDTLEEQIVADADVISHLDGIPFLFFLAYNRKQLSAEKGSEFVKNKLTQDFQKLSPQGQKELKERFDIIMKMLFVE